MNTLADRRVKARKPHVCDTCGKVIQKGEEYRYSKHEYDGTLYDWHSCDRCANYVSECFDMDYCDSDCGLTEETFWEFMNDYHPEIAAKWSGEVDK